MAGLCATGDLSERLEGKKRMMATRKKMAGRRLDEVLREFLQTPKERAAYVDAVLADTDRSALKAAIRDVARSRAWRTRRAVRA